MLSSRTRPSPTRGLSSAEVGQRFGRACDQIYTMRADGSDVRMVSTGKGRTTCSYFFPRGGRLPEPLRELRARAEKEIGYRRRNRETSGHVLGIHDGEIDLMLLLQVLQTIEQRRASRLTNNIANEQKLHKDGNSKW